MFAAGKSCAGPFGFTAAPREKPGSSGRTLAKWFFAGPLSLALACLPVTPPPARAELPAVESKAQPAAKACPLFFDSNALLSLARRCAINLAGDANCRAYAKDEDEGYVIARDCSARKPEAYLLIPLTPVTGIEDRRIFSPALAGLWEDAWAWSRKYPGRPAAMTGLAINSKRGRSQDQLHIHLSCALSPVRMALASADVPFYPAKALSLALGPDQNAYKAVKVRALTGENSPFNIARALAGEAPDLQKESLAVIGSGRPGEYYVLETKSTAARPAHAEELLDQTCAAGEP